MFVDTHSHLLTEYYEDKKQIITNAKNNNINKIFVSGYDTKSNTEILNDVENYTEIYGTIGIHPNNCKNASDEDINFIIENINKEKIIAVGEIGLDFYYDDHDKEKQLYFFEKQLKIAEDHKLPVIIHSRNSSKDIIKILKKYNVKGIIHSFTEDIKTAQKYINMGFLLGINGIVTFKNSNLIDTIKTVGVENIVLETDSPYLTPVPLRGKLNEPKNIALIAKYLCHELNITIEELSNITNNNIKRIFDI